MPDTTIQLPVEGAGKRLRMVQDGTLTDDGYPVYAQVVTLKTEKAIVSLLTDIVSELREIHEALDGINSNRGYA